jgi:hypothetical protein
MRILFILVALFTLPITAHAHYVVWGDSQFGYSLSFPDTWKQQGGLPADGRIKVMAPGADSATCTVFARTDKRFTIYPREYMVDVVAQEVNWDYWEQAVSNYDDLYFYYDNYGMLGAGDARYTLVDYIDNSGATPMRKRAMVHATMYGDMQMMVHCSAAIKAFDTYAADFGQIVESIQMDPKYTPTYRGYYRDFLETKEYNHHWHERIVLFFLPRKGMSAVVNCPRAKDIDGCLFKLKPPPIQTR